MLLVLAIAVETTRRGPSAGGARQSFIPRPATDHFRVVVDRERSPDEIALHFVASLIGEECELFFGFDTLGQHRQLQPAREPDHRADDRRGLRVGPDVRYEGLIDLDPVERKRLQIGGSCKTFESGRLRIYDNALSG
jgi:hypothetical protein